MHQFLSSTAWDDAPLWRVLATEAGRLVGGKRAVLVVDDTGLPKKGSASVGVAPQYCGQLGKQANCQALVSLTLAQDEMPVPVGLRLFLAKTWVEEPRPVDAVLATAKRRRVAWRQGSKGALSARFAALRIRVGDGAPTRTAHHLPGDEAWLVGEWRDNGERKFYLSNLAPRRSLRALAAAIKARWVWSRRTSNSSRRWASVTSRAAPGPACTAMR